MAVRAQQLTFLLFGLLPALAAADCTTLPQQNIRWIVSNTTGSSYDVYARTMVPELEKQLGRQIVVENLSGGGGLVGARAVAGAVPDGSTLGLVNGAGLITAGLVGRKRVPRLTEDFEILGRASAMRHVWAVAADNRFTIGNLLERNTKIVFAVRNVASTSFVSLSVGAHLLDVPHAFVVGYASNRDTRLAAGRGEVDVVSMDISSGQKQIASGLLRPFLQIAPAVIDHPALSGNVPILTELLGADPGKRELAFALFRLLGSNRLFVTPPGLRAEISECLQHAIHNTLLDERTGRALEQRAAPIRFADATVARADLEELAVLLPRLKPVVTAAIATTTFGASRE